MSGTHPSENNPRDPGQHQGPPDAPDFVPGGEAAPGEPADQSGPGRRQGDPDTSAGYSDNRQGDPNAATHAGTTPQGDPNLPPGYPPAGAVPPPSAGFMPPGQEAPKGRSLGRRLISVVVAVIVALAVGFLVRSGIFDTKMAAGDCLQQTGADSVKVVGCDSADAQYTILGVKENLSKVAAQAGACNDWPDTTSIYWEGRNTASGTIYCLQKR